MEQLQQLLAPYYIYIKYIHMVSVMMWAFSTTVAWFWFVKHAHLKSKLAPKDEEMHRRRNWAYEQFDRGAKVEHIALPVLLVTGAMLYIAAGWTLESPWLLVKLAIVIGLFIPIEIFDYYLAHGPGNKHYVKTNKPEKLEESIQLHWKFINVTTIPLALAVFVVLFLAIVKPALW